MGGGGRTLACRVHRGALRLKLGHGCYGDAAYEWAGMSWSVDEPMARSADGAQLNSAFRLCVYVSGDRVKPFIRPMWTWRWEGRD